MGVCVCGCVRVGGDKGGCVCGWGAWVCVWVVTRGEGVASARGGKLGVGRGRRLI